MFFNLKVLCYFIIFLRNLCSNRIAEFASPQRDSSVRLFVTPLAKQFMEFSRPEYWNDTCFLLQGSSQTRDQIQVSLIAGRFFTTRATREVQEYWSGQSYPPLADLPGPGIEPGSPALKVDSLPAELSGKPFSLRYISKTTFKSIEEKLQKQETQL